MAMIFNADYKNNTMIVNLRNGAFVVSGKYRSALTGEYRFVTGDVSEWKKQDNGCTIWENGVLCIADQIRQGRATIRDLKQRMKMLPECDMCYGIG